MLGCVRLAWLGVRQGGAAQGARGGEGGGWNEGGSCMRLVLVETGQFVWGGGGGVSTCLSGADIGHSGHPSSLSPHLPPPPPLVHLQQNQL